MTFEEALEIMKRGGDVTRGGRIFRIDRGVKDVTDPSNVNRSHFDEDDRNADDWADAIGVGLSARTDPPAVVDPEVVDKALHETIPETLGTLDE
jgi:hypothetical protein